MKKSIFKILLFSALVFGITACQSGDKKNQSVEENSKVEVNNNIDKPKNSVKSICFVVTGQLGDKSFNDSAASGIKKISETMGIETKVIEIGRDQTKWEPTFMDLAEEAKYDIIITNGSNAGELIQDLSIEFPDQKFILFDTEIPNGKYPNVYAMSYKQNEGSYLAGVLAAMVTNSSMEYANPDKKIGFIGGEEHPIISDFLVGYVEGAKSIDPEIKVYVSYIGSWDDTAKGKETALNQYNQGVDIIFPAAEQAGLGCIDAAIELNKYIIGVDSDQALLFKGIDEKKANIILSSVLKEVGNTLFRAVELENEKKLPWGNFESLGVTEGGTGLAFNEYFEKNISDEIKTKIKEAEKAVSNGNVKVTSALGKDSLKADEIIKSVAP